MDITYVPLARGFVYLAAVAEWFSRKVLAWRLSITLTADFCIEALEEALVRHEQPKIFNTEQESQLNSLGFTQVLKDALIAISMDGKSAWRDECLRRVALADREIRGSLPARLCQRLRDSSLDRPLSGFYHGTRSRSSIGGQTPDRAYLNQPTPILAAA